MTEKSFTSTISKSTFLISLLTNFVTSIVLFLVTLNLMSKIYTNHYTSSLTFINSYISNVMDNSELYDKMSNLYFENLDKINDFSIREGVLQKKVVNQNGYNNKIVQAGNLFELNNLEKFIFSNYRDNNIHNKILTRNNKVYIYNIIKINDFFIIEYLNLSESLFLKQFYIKDGLLGYLYNDEKFIFNGVKIKQRHSTVVYDFPEESGLDGLSLYFSMEEQYINSLILLFSILLFAGIRLLSTLLNAKSNLRKITKPLEDLVNNTERLAAHEVSEKLRAIDYPYTEFKKLSEAFNEVLLSREISELKLFRSFEQMENTVQTRTEELLEANKQLTLAMKKAEEVTALKSQFLANISHEIRTPLNCIIGFCDIILAENQSEAVSTQVNHILHESETLLHLINDFLDYSKVDAGKMKIGESELDIRTVINSLMKSGQVQVGDRNIILSSEISEEVPAIILSDELRLYQIISNIFYNAIKFTQNGSVKILIDCQQLEGNNINLLVSISDTGIGIPKDRLESIFNQFEQVDGSLTRQFRGSGLGLTICNKIIELMHGEIEVLSEENKGTTFNLVIPVKYGTKAIENSVSEIDENIYESDKSGSRILLVEDYPVNQIVAKKHLEVNNHIVVVSENGKEAVLETMKSKFDLILMDLQMPVMDGFQATQQIRSSENINSTTPILAMTANAMDTAKQSCLESGMNGIITKPIRKHSFLKEINKWL